MIVVSNLIDTDACAFRNNGPNLFGHLRGKQFFHFPAAFIDFKICKRHKTDTAVFDSAKQIFSADLNGGLRHNCIVRKIEVLYLMA